MHNNRIFFNFLVKYILMLIIPISISFFAYEVAVKIVKDDAISTNITMLNQTADILDMLSIEADSFATQLINDTDISEFKYYTGAIDHNSLINVFDISKKLYKYTYFNNFINGIYLYFKNSDTIITPNSKYTPEDFYNIHLQKYIRSGFNNWYKILSEGSDKKLCFSEGITKNGQDPIVTFMYPLALIDSEQSLGMLVFTLDNERLKQILLKSTYEESGTVYIVDKNNNILNFAGNEEFIVSSEQINSISSQQGFYFENVRGIQVIVTYASSANLGWKYISLLPYNIIMNKVNIIIKIMFICVSICLIIGILFAFFLAYKSSNPITLLLNDVISRTNKKYYGTYNGIYRFLKNVNAGI